MTSVDQAFLKAFARPATVRPNLAAQRRVTLAEAIEARAKVAQEQEHAETEAVGVAICAPAKESTDEDIAPSEPTALAEAVAAPKPSTSIAEALAARLERMTSTDQSPAVLPMPARPAPPETNKTSPDADAAEPILQLLRPALRLERFPWPASVARLNKSHAGQLDGIVKTLLAAQRDGKKIIGLIAHGRGEGVSTVTLAVARRLGDGALRVAVADGDWSQPQLARRLALLSEGGWEAVLAGRRTLAAAMVEAADGRLAVLPSVAAPAINPETIAQLDKSLNVLRQNYDLLLIDLPPVDGAATLLPKLDAAVIVQHTQRAGEAEISAVRQRLVAAGVDVLGVVQNCVTE